ncbi:MAG: HEAT repeat domain-containing protein [Planctomycetota bacterium]
MRITLLALLLGLLLPATVWAHGGSFRGPNGGVPPGLRAPGDPEPPPPPPTPPGEPGDVDTPRGGPNGPESGHETPNGTTPPPTPQPPPGPGPKTGKTSNSITFDSWRFWWAYNNDDILNLKSRKIGISTSSPLFHGQGDAGNFTDAMRPTRDAIVKRIIPALQRSLNRARDHQDIHGGALIALGKVGTTEFLPLFDAAAHNRHRTDKDVPVKLGLQATESAVLALGMLPDVPEARLPEIRAICLKIIRDDEMRSRERAWAAVNLGLQRDAGAVKPLLELLDAKYTGEAKRNVPAGILVALGLIGDPLALPALERGFQDRRLDDRVRSFYGYAIGKLASAGSVEMLARQLSSRRTGRILKRSIAIALGTCAATAKPETQELAVRALQSFLRKSGGDRAGEYFSLIALSRIGNETAIETLLDYLAKGKLQQKHFAALGLGTWVRYREQAGNPVEDETLDTIRKGLRRFFAKNRDTEARAAAMIARGLVRDATALDDLVDIVSKRGDAKLRGPCCVAIGLMGRQHVSAREKEALFGALRNRSDIELRRDAATALGLLQDARTVDVLIEELEKSKSFTVQGQLILAIGTIGDEKAIDPLIEILDNTSRPEALRAMAAVGLGMIGDTQLIPRLARMSKDYNYRASVADLDELLFIL